MQLKPPMLSAPQMHQTGKVAELGRTSSVTCHIYEEVWVTWGGRGEMFRLAKEISPISHLLSPLSQFPPLPLSLWNAQLSVMCVGVPAMRRKETHVPALASHVPASQHPFPATPNKTGVPQLTMPDPQTEKPAFSSWVSPLKWPQSPAPTFHLENSQNTTRCSLVTLLFRESQGMFSFMFLIPSRET